MNLIYAESDLANSRVMAGRETVSSQSLVFIGLTWPRNRLNPPLYGWTNYLVSLGFLFTSCKIGIIILATNGNCLVGMLYAFV